MSDTIEVNIQDGDTIEVSVTNQLIINVAMEMLINIALGDNVIPHNLGKEVVFLTAMYNGRLLQLDWTNADPDTGIVSTTNIYFPDSLTAYNNVTLYIS